MSTKTKAQPGAQLDDPMFNRAEAAHYLGTTERWIKAQLEHGRMPFTKLGRYVRFRKSDLDRYIAERTTIPEDGEL